MEHKHWWVLLEGLLGIFVGLVSLTAPRITATVPVLCIGFWAIATWALRIVLAMRLRKEIGGEWWMVLAGLVNVVFGVMVTAKLGTGALALLWLIATWAIVGGVFLVLLSFKVKGLAGRMDELKRQFQIRAGA